MYLQGFCTPPKRCPPKRCLAPFLAPFLGRLAKCINIANLSIVKDFLERSARLFFSQTCQNAKQIGLVVFVNMLGSSPLGAGVGFVDGFNCGGYVDVVESGGALCF